MGNTNGNNILFFFDTKNIQQKTGERNYINCLCLNNETGFSGEYNYITAGARAIHDMLNTQNKDIDDIICVSDLGDENREYFKSSFNKIFKHDIKLTLINYTSNDSSDIILTYISDKYTFSETDTIYILTNSGLRNNVMFFSTFTQIIQAKGIDTKLIYIDQGSPKEKTETIKDVTSDNKYFDVLRAVEMFIQSGNPKKLKEIYATENDNKGTTDLSKLLGFMEQFYKNIQICKPVNDDSDIVQIYEKMLDEIDNLMKKDKEVDIIIRLLLPTIKSKFMPLGEKYNEPFIQILQWCCNNDMLLTGFFILDAEYKNYLYGKEVIKFKEFILDDEYKNQLINKNIKIDVEKLIINNQKIFLTSPDADIINKISNKDRDNYFEGIQKLSAELSRKNYNQCLTVIFRNIVGNTWYIDCTRLNPDYPNNSYFQKIKKCLKDWEICLYPDNKKNLKLYELILLQDFIRNLRNSMAHSDIKSTIKDKQNVRYFVKNTFNKENNIFNSKYKAKNDEEYDDITFDDIGIYDKLKFILEQSIKIIQENVKCISVEVKENGN